MEWDLTFTPYTHVIDWKFLKELRNKISSTGLSKQFKLIWRLFLLESNIQWWELKSTTFLTVKTIYELFISVLMQVRASCSKPWSSRRSWPPKVNMPAKKHITLNDGQCQLWSWEKKVVGRKVRQFFSVFKAIVCTFLRLEKETQCQTFEAICQLLEREK